MEGSWRQGCLLRLLFLLNALSTSTWGRFGAIYYLDKGLSKVEIGIIEGLMPLVAVITQSLWALVADAKNAKKEVFLGTNLLSASCLMLLAVPQIVKRSFWRILVVSLSSKIFSSAGILDAYVLKSAGMKMYGRLRLWGSIGWGTGALAMGVLNDRYGFGPNFAFYGTFNFLKVAILAMVVPSERQITTAKLLSPPRTPELENWAALWNVLRSWKLMMFLGEIFLFGAAIGVVERLLFVYIVDVLHGGATLCGLVVLVSSLCNIPIFHHGALLLDRLGTENLMLLSQLCYFTRVFGYTVLEPQTKYYILFLETLHGLTFATLWVAAVDQARSLAPPGWDTSLQSALQSVYYALGPGVGALVGGFLWRSFSPRVMYRSFAAAVFGLFVLRLLRRLWCCCCCFSRGKKTRVVSVQRRCCASPSSSSDYDDDDDHSDDVISGSSSRRPRNPLEEPLIIPYDAPENNDEAKDVSLPDLHAVVRDEDLS